MKYASILPLVIFVAMCAGQESLTAVSSRNTSAAPGLHIYHGSCPVDLQVEHSGLFVERNAKYGSWGDVARSVPEQRLELIMSNLLPKEIVSAEITAHGFSHQGRLIPLSNTNPTPDLAKTVYVTLDVEGNGRASRDLSFAYFAAITTIDVNSVTYANGSAWHASSSRACSFIPNGFMRVGLAR